MLHRIALFIGAAVLVFATAASAQVEIRGVVSHVDPVTRTVYLTDGRMVQLERGSTVVVNGQTLAFESLRPGMSFVLAQAPGQTTTVTTVTQQTEMVAPPVMVAAPMMVAIPLSSPVSVTGTIARVDPLAETITFQDGRVVRLGPQTRVWQQSSAVSTLQPGAQVMVRDAVPIGYLPSSPVSAAPAGQWVLGTVSRVEPASQQIVLSDGTVVRLAPTARLRMGHEHVALTSLRPGDEIVMMRPATMSPAPGATTMTADHYVGSALPYQGTRVEASDVIIIWSPQSR